MLKIENAEVVGWEHAVRGLRNPMNSWSLSDSFRCRPTDDICPDFCPYVHIDADDETLPCNDDPFIIGPKDMKLMMSLRDSGTDHRKFLRMITVYVDILAPLYWWKEFDTYKVGTVANSCSTMHKIADKEFTLDDFSHEHLIDTSLLEEIITELNIYRDIYNNYEKQTDGYKTEFSRKNIWWQMIQLLPSSYNQKRTVMLNYEVLANIYKSRRNHRLDEWIDICDWIESLPYSELITGEEND